MSNTKPNTEDSGFDYSTQQEIPEGKIVDYITGKWVKESDVEQVRQNFERTLVEEYSYTISEIRVDFKIKVWDGDKQKTKKAPLVVVKESTEDPIILIIVANPKSNPTDKSGGTTELEQWMVDIASAEVDPADSLEKIIEECARLGVSQFKKAELHFEGLPAIGTHSSEDE